ncbi:MAG: flagellar protein FliT [Selenomonas ruminantium]|uniref:Flagellar protein FliT n=2 Tax=Selenomonas ruminantium TaxID=971 RepID=A0A927WIS8_SELRU|nr:flagellar protein FliT [Selenomonas ruminantium]
MSAKNLEPMEQAKANWRLYYTLTQELLKFIDNDDVDQFLDLEQQRGDLVDRMKALPETEVYRKTQECQELVQKIKPLDMQVIYKAKAWLNRSRQQNASVHAYDIQGLNTLGNIFNKKY